jgi:hypothetical protein
MVRAPVHQHVRPLAGTPVRGNGQVHGTQWVEPVELVEEGRRTMGDDGARADGKTLGQDVSRLGDGCTMNEKHPRSLPDKPAGRDQPLLLRPADLQLAKLFGGDKAVLDLGHLGELREHGFPSDLPELCCELLG